MDRSCRLLHGLSRQPFEWNYFPLLTGRIVLSSKKRDLRKYSVFFFKHFPKKKVIWRALYFVFYKFDDATKNILQFWIYKVANSCHTYKRESSVLGSYTATVMSRNILIRFTPGNTGNQISIETFLGLTSISGPKKIKLQ